MKNKYVFGDKKYFLLVKFHNSKKIPLKKALKECVTFFNFGSSLINIVKQ